MAHHGQLLGPLSLLCDPRESGSLPPPLRARRTLHRLRLLAHVCRGRLRGAPLHTRPRRLHSLLPHHVDLAGALRLDHGRGEHRRRAGAMAAEPTLA
eukprot:scaffold55565_cov75-Phaeocystis_antarctica.AAC.1